MEVPFINILNNTEIFKLSDVINQINLIDISSTFQPNKKEYVFLSAPQVILFQTDHILGHESSLNKYKKIKITSYIIYDHHRLKLNINNNRKK